MAVKAYATVIGRARMMKDRRAWRIGGWWQHASRKDPFDPFRNRCKDGCLQHKGVAVDQEKALRFGEDAPQFLKIRLDLIHWDTPKGDVPVHVTERAAVMGATHGYL